MNRNIPEFQSDEEAAAFLEQDLSDLDFAQFKPKHFEFERKTAQINMRLPKSLLDAVKERSTALWSAVATWSIVRVLDRLIGIRVSREEERDGLDLSTHGERAYDLM
ncbi:MAG: CopG family antitoxin [Stellaceae bacterium]